MAGETQQKPMRMIANCAQCGESFGSAYEVKQHIKEVHLKQRLEKLKEPTPQVKKEETKPEVTPVPVEPPATKPPVVAEAIVLHYRFNGQCPKCLHEPRTLMLDVAEDLFAVAYCNNCDKKLRQVKVVPIK